ncbi:hypothetical protein BZA05DRAFT_99237 [Tricharina praecox]|uniref:uncharacterized protein n=1 Tax=Tricharina praecox TaxID=43433 RepID=UPI002220E8C1|nr:uncharacterized protein BZA05DRAFT_99237 [Tricharina praecox]KAI5857551.1 hypothetical protein BZA05DRAFT_99237 [Tricharina praecox]
MTNNPRGGHQFYFASISLFSSERQYHQPQSVRECNYAALPIALLAHSTILIHLYHLLIHLYHLFIHLYHLPFHLCKLISSSFSFVFLPFLPQVRLQGDPHSTKTT